MSRATQQQDVCVLSAAKRGLSYLTPNDWTLIVDKAARRQFKKGDCIVEHTHPTHGMYLLLKGSASVQIVSQLAFTIGPGEICGEISFLDGLPATAKVVAQESVEAYFLDQPTLHTLFELFPHLGSRFYRSLATGLAYRMRTLLSPVSTTEQNSGVNH